MDIEHLQARKAVGQHRTSMSSSKHSGTIRAPHPSPSRGYSFTFSDLHNVLYRQSEVEVIRFEDAKPTERLKTNERLKEAAAACEICRGEPKSDCPVHRSAVLPRRSSHPGPQQTYAVSSFPEEVQLCRSSVPGAGYGVSAKQHIPVGTWIGPYEGRRIKPEEVTSDSDTTYMWEIFQEGKLVCYLDARDENTSSWMRFIRCARYREEQNLYAFQYCGNIYYRAFRDINIGQELLVWYDDKYQQYMGIPLNMQDMAIVDTNGNPLLFDLLAYHNQRAAAAAAATSSQSKEKTPVTQSTRAPFPAQRPASNVVSQCHSSEVTSSVTVTQQVGAHAKRTMSYPIKQVTQPFPVNVTQPVKVNIMHPCSGSVTVSKDSVTSSIKQCVTHPTPINHPLYSSAYSSMRRHRLPSGDKTMAAIDELRYLQKTYQTHAPSNHKTPSPKFPDVKLSSINNERGSIPAETKLEQIANEIAEEYIDEEGFIEFSEDGDISFWKCGQCEKSFAQRALLQIHICPGMANRPYKCGHCSEAFALSNELRTHVVTHTNEKPFKCGYCSRTFAGATTLNNHMRTHTGEKPFNCLKCGRNFSQPSQLSKHQRCPAECRM